MSYTHRSRMKGTNLKMEFRRLKLPCRILDQAEAFAERSRIPLDQWLSEMLEVAIVDQVKRGTAKPTDEHYTERQGSDFPTNLVE